MPVRPVGLPSRHLEGYVRACPHQVQLDLDEPSRVYQPGDLVTGRVTIHPGVAAHAHLVLELQVYAQGEVKAVTLLAQAQPETLHLQAGAPVARRFQLQVPIGVPTYRGRLFSLQPRVAAVLDGPTSSGGAQGDDDTAAESGSARAAMRRAVPASSIGVHVAVDQRPPVVSVDPLALQRLSASSHHSLVLAWSLTLAGPAMIITGVAMGMLGPDGGNGSLTLSIFAGALALMGLGGLVGSVFAWIPLVLRRAAERRMGVPQFVVREENDARGPMLRIWVSGDARSGLLRGSATLRVSEEIDCAESDLREDSFVLAEQRLELSPTSEPSTLFGELSRAALVGAPAEVDLMVMRVSWTLQVRLQFAGVAAWRGDLSLHAPPGGEAAALPEQEQVSFVE